MANQDFLITFSVDGQQAIRMMDLIGQKATALEARLNALGRGAGGTGGGVAGGILTNLGLAPAQVTASARSVSALETQVARLSDIRKAGETLGFRGSAGALQTEAIATRRLAEELGPMHSRYQTLITSSNQLASQSKILANQMDQTGQAFGRHAQRIFEGILIYEAFGRAVQAIQAGIGLIIDIERESRRLEAVLEINPTQAGGFIQNVGQIASETVTPLEDLVSEADRAASAFLDMEDPLQRAAAAEELLRNAGAFTTVTQRDLGTEVKNLIAIMKQLNIPIGDLDDFLGKIVVAGGNASTVISALSDSLQISGRAATSAGADLDILLASQSAFIVETGRTGSEVGATFNILFQRLGDPDVIDKITGITHGMLELRDAAGQIRDPFAVLLELNALLKAQLISPTDFKDVIAALAPPLQPQRQFDFQLIISQLNELGPAVEKIGAGGADALDDLVKKINDALGPQLKKLIIDAQIAFLNLFSEDVTAGGLAIIDFIRNIGKALALIPPDILRLVIEIGSLLVGLKLLTSFGGRLLSVMGIGGIRGSFIALGRDATLAGGAVTRAGTAFMLFGRTIFTAGGLVAGLVRQLGFLLPLIAAFMAFDFASNIGDMQTALKGQIGGSLVGMNREQLLARRREVEGELTADHGVDENIVRAFTVNPALREALAEIDRLLLQIGTDGTVAAESLSTGFQAAADDIEDAAADTAVGRAQEAQANAFEQAALAAEEKAAALANMTAQERFAVESADLLTTLVDEQAVALRELNDRLREGEISQAQWNQGQTEVQQAADISAQLVAQFGDQLRTLIPVLGDAGEGNEALAGALFEVILQSSNGLPSILNWANAAISMAQGANAAARATLAAAQAQLVFQTLLRTGNLFQTVIQLQKAASAIAAFNAQIFASNQNIAGLFQNINQAFGTTGSVTFGTGPSAPSASAAPQQLPILDIGDLDPAQLAQLIGMATALRNAIPGETEASLDSLVAAIKDGQFLQTISGIDDRLLRIALEELIEVEKKRLALEEAQLREGILRNLVTNVGPLGALISQPTAFGVGGSLALGSGLNIDPNSGNFVINMPINWTGMDLPTLQSLIAATIAQAIQDALRTGG